MAEILIADGYQDFMGGQDASRIPCLIPENCYSSGVNVTVKQGLLQPRWGWDRWTLQFPEGYILDPYKRIKTYRQIFESGKFQAACPFYIGSTQYIVLVVAGQIFLLNPATKVLSTITIEDGSMLNSRAKRINWTVAGDYLVFFDFPAFPVLLKGISARRADPAKYEVPVSVIGSFNENRLFISNNGKEFTGGDPVGNTATPDAPITFEEVLTSGSPYFHEIYKLPTVDHNDPITFMGFLQVSDTSTGIGPLLIGTSRAIYSFNTQNVRTNWTTSQFGSIVCYNAGVAGPRAFTNVNSDAFFLSTDGYLRSFTMSRQEQGKWARIPISREVENWFQTFDKSLTSLSFVSYFKNKVLIGVAPYRTPAIDFSTNREISDYAHGGFAVLGLDNVSAFGEAAKPIWEGLWTGVNPMEVVTLGDRAFIVSKDAGINSIYEINPDTTYDTADSHVRYIRSRIHTREFDFQDPYLNKEIHSVNLNMNQLQGDFEIDIKYRPNHSETYFPFRNFKHTAPWRTCNMPEDCFIEGFAGHYIRDFDLGSPEDNQCSPITNDFYRVLRKIQLELTITGKYWELEELRVRATPRLQTNIQSICDPYPAIAICKDCSDDWKVEPFESCQTLAT